MLDHDHSTGFVRGVLDRGCNSLLGKVENNYRRFGVSNLAAFLGGVYGYLRRHNTPQEVDGGAAVRHPTYKEKK